MNLLEIRKLFIKASGRYDLVYSNYRNRGADYYINAGQRLLDSQFERTDSEAWHTPVSGLTEGSYYLDIDHCRYVKKVLVVSDTGTVRLERKNLRWMIKNYPQPFSLGQGGTPVYYAVIPSRTSPELEHRQASEFTGLVDTSYQTFGTEDYGKTRLLILPKADKDYEIEILASFYSRPFTGEWFDQDRENNLAATEGLRLRYSDGSVWKCLSSGTLGSQEPDILGAKIESSITDGDVTVEKVSHFSEIDDKTYWSEKFPEALVLAAQAQLEASYGNLTGFANRLASIREIVRGTLVDVSGKDFTDGVQMESSWRV